MGRRFLHKLTALLLLPIPFPKWMIALARPVRGRGASILFWIQSLMGVAFIVMGIVSATLGLRYGDVFRSLGDARAPIIFGLGTAGFIASGVIIIWFGWKDYRRTRRTERGLCPQCGYDLRASPERCPECGNVTSPEMVWSKP